MESRILGDNSRAPGGRNWWSELQSSPSLQPKQLHFFSLKYWASTYSIFLKVQQLKNKDQIYFCFQKNGLDVLFPISPAKYKYIHGHYIQNKHKKSLKGGEKEDFLGT